MERCRRWSFTNYNLDFDYSKLKGVDYIIVGLEECPETKRKHHQCYIEFKNPRYFNGVQKDLKGCHLEKSKGGAEANIRYCSKDENVIYVEGTPKKQGKRSDLEKCKELIQKGVPMNEVADCHFKTWCHNHKALDRYAELCRIKKKTKPKVFLYCGNLEKAKDRAYNCHENLEDIEFENGFFTHNISGECVLLADVNNLGIGQRKLIDMFGKHPKRVNVKNGWTDFRAKVVVCTSELHPDVWAKPLNGLQHLFDVVVEL